jgi:hypothetical protein
MSSPQALTAALSGSENRRCADDSARWTRKIITSTATSGSITAANAPSALTGHRNAGSSALTDVLDFTLEGQSVQ